jgi:hypothetical protein
MIKLFCFLEVGSAEEDLLDSGNRKYKHYLRARREQQNGDPWTFSIRAKINSRFCKQTVLA